MHASLMREQVYNHYFSNHRLVIPVTFSSAMQRYKGSILLERTNITDTHVFQTYIAEQLVYESNCLCEVTPHISQIKIFDFQTSV